MSRLWVGVTDPTLRLDESPRIHPTIAGHAAIAAAVLPVVDGEVNR